MWSESYIEPRPGEDTPPEEPVNTGDLSQQFLRSLRPQPGCEKDGICNECGLCEH